MTPRAGVPGLLNRRPLDPERPLEGPGFDGLAERQLFQESFPVAARLVDQMLTTRSEIT